MRNQLNASLIISSFSSLNFFITSFLLCNSFFSFSTSCTFSSGTTAPLVFICSLSKSRLTHLLSSRDTSRSYSALRTLSAS